MVGCKLARPTVKGHDTADDERVQLRRVPTSKLVGLGRLQILIETALWGCIMRQVWRPVRWGIGIQVRLHGGMPIRGHWSPPTWRVTLADDLGWHGRWCTWEHRVDDLRRRDWGCWV